MNRVKLFVLAILVSVTGNVLAQKTKITSGTFSELKGQKEVNVIFDYSEATVSGGAPFASRKPAPESEWLGKIIDKKNEKEAGKGDDWKKRWESAKSGPFAGNFETKLSAVWKDAIVKRGLDNAKYTLYIKVTYMDPGYSTGTGATDAWLSAIIEVRETGTETVVSSATMERIKGQSAAKFAPGMAGAIAGGIDGAKFEKRLGESFEKMGKSLYAKVLKKAFK